MNAWNNAFIQALFHALRFPNFAMTFKFVFSGGGVRGAVRASQQDLHATHLDGVGMIEAPRTTVSPEETKSRLGSTSVGSSSLNGGPGVASDVNSVGEVIPGDALDADPHYEPTPLDPVRRPSEELLTEPIFEQFHHSHSHYDSAVIGTAAIYDIEAARVPG